MELRTHEPSRRPGPVPPVYRLLSIVVNNRYPSGGYVSWLSLYRFGLGARSSLSRESTRIRHSLRNGRSLRSDKRLRTALVAANRPQSARQAKAERMAASLATTF